MLCQLLMTYVTLSTIGIYAFSAESPNVSTPTSAPPFKVKVLTTSSHNTVDQQYLSLAVPANLCKTTRLSNFRTSDVKLRNLARALSPAVVRFGGTDGHFQIFQPENGQPAVPDATRKEWEAKFGGADFYTGRVGKKNSKNYNCTASSYLALKEFFQNVSWDVSLQMNHLLTQNGRWDPSNARLWLDSLNKMGMEVKYFALTSEPNSFTPKFGFHLPPENTTEDFRIFREFLNSTAYKNSQVLGPDVTSLVRSRHANKYLDDMMELGLWKYIDGITLHHYYLSGKEADRQDFMGWKTYDQSTLLMEKAIEVKVKHNLTLPVLLTETSSAFGGGAANLSNRYAGAMIWLDQLGLIALNGGKRVNRQTFWAGEYSLVDNDNYDPTPGYFVSVLFKRLVNGPVLNVTLTPTDHQLRVYAHCARTDGPYHIRKGAVVIYYINLRTREDQLDIGQFSGQTFDLFQLRKRGDLESNEMFLNNKVLSMRGDDLPAMPPLRTGSTILTIDKRGMGFIVCQEANATVCL